MQSKQLQGKIGRRIYHGAVKVKRRIILLLLLVFIAAVFPVSAQENRIRPGEREVARAILADARSDLFNNYYDPKFHGIDINARFKEADDRIKKATSLNQALAIVAWALEGLHDSHTFFIPPPRPFHLFYGWTMQMIGDKCYVTGVEPGSDAEKKSLKPGDLVEEINKIPPTRDNLWTLNYLFRTLRPQPGFELMLRGVDGKERTLEIAAKIIRTRLVTDFASLDFWNEVRDSESAERLMQRRSKTVGPDVIVWKFPSFLINEKGADEMIGQSRKYKTMVLDLRDDHGGIVKAMQRLTGDFFENDINIGEVKQRKKSEPQTAKGRQEKRFSGKLIVLVDSESASAAEIFARLIQLQKRGTIIGDRTSGSVMEARVYPHQLGLDQMIFYASYVSVADWIMPDGKSLEHSGVIPDEVMLPTAADLANHKDPVLARAISLGGAQISAEDAFKLFPQEWVKH